MQQEIERHDVADHLILLQLLVAGAVALVIYLVKDGVAAYSLILGALCGIIPTCLFALIAIKAGASQKPDMTLIILCSGVLLKFLLAAGLFVMVITLVKPIESLMALTGLIVTQLAVVVAPIIGHK